MKLHPLCAEFPEYGKKELRELADDIKKSGQTDKIVILDGQILDGRNRFLACKLAGVEPQFEEFKGKDPRAFVVSKNLLPGRQLTAMQRANIAAKLFPASNEADAPSQREVADLFGVSRSSVQRAVAKTKEAPEPASWTLDELKKDKPLLDALMTIAGVYGNNDTKAIREGAIGLKRADVMFLAALPKEKMQEVRDLVMSERWDPKRAITFLGKMPTDDTTIQELKYLCLATKGLFYQGDFDGFTVSIKNNRAPKRDT